MKNKLSMITVYAEGIVYIVALILTMYLCLVDNLYITMIPIAFIVGFLGQITFGKRIMTTFFCSIITIILKQIKTPSLLGDNIVTTLKIAVLVLLGEGAAWGFKRFYRLAKKKKNVSKKIKIEKVKCFGVFAVILIAGMVLSGIFNGNYISHSIAKKNLVNYFIENYNSGTRFKIITSKYENFVYTFYTQDTMGKNAIGKFNVYENMKYEVHDSYEEQIKDKLAKDITSSIEKLELDDSLTIYAQNNNANEITLSFIKTVDNINKAEIEEYANQIKDSMEKIKDISNYTNIKQLKIILNSKVNDKDSLASYIYMTSYEDVINSGADVVEYITNALNIEYFD